LSGLFLYLLFESGSVNTVSDRVRINSARNLNLCRAGVTMPVADSPDSFFQSIAEQIENELPPVHLWHPAETKDIGMLITRDGTWWHQGSPIGRRRMVRLFSRVLRREGNDYFLVTPVEKVRVDVEVAPLLAVRMGMRDVPEPEITFHTNVGDVVVVDREHSIRMLGTPEAPLPVVEVRNGIEALMTRNVYYELVERCELVRRNGDEVAVVRSRGCTFELGMV